MPMTVNWRWSMPAVADPNAQSNSMGQGVQALAQGIGGMIRNGREEDWKRRQQQNWQEQFDFNRAQAAQQQGNWNRQFEQSRKIQDAALARQQEQDEWLRKFYDAYFGGDDEWKELQELRKMFGGSGDAELTLMGLNPLLMR